MSTWKITDTWRVYITQGQGEVLAGEYNSLAEAEMCIDEIIEKKEGSARLVRLWEADQE